MALMAFDIGRGDAVITTPFSFFATVEAICLLGATPIFVDIDPKTFNLDPIALERTLHALSEDDRSSPAVRVLHRRGKLKPRAIIPVDLFGLPADYNAIRRIARIHSLNIIEDAAQAFGARYHGKHAGTLGDIGCTSFFPAKPMGCYGDGGMCFTDVDEHAHRMKSIRNHGEGQDHGQHVRMGLNARMDTFQAAVLLAKRSIFAEECVARSRNAKRYNDLFGDHPRLMLPSVPEHYESAWAQYSILADSKDHRDKIVERLQIHKIPTAVYYPIPIHLQVAMGAQGYRKGDFPVSEDCADRVFSLPIHPYLNSAEQSRIVKIITYVIA
jgi:dTDP-4-amino-4,6-dideoxygalactose transaminase